MLLAISSSLALSTKDIEESKANQQSFAYKLKNFAYQVLKSVQDKMKRVNTYKKHTNINVCVWKICSKPLKAMSVKTLTLTKNLDQYKMEKANRMNFLLRGLYYGQYFTENFERKL